MFVLAWLLLRGRTGRAFRAVRDSEIAAASSGVSLPLYKTLAFGHLVGVRRRRGSLYVLVNNFVNPDVFALALSLYHPDRGRRRRPRLALGRHRGRGFRASCSRSALTTSHITSSQSVPVIFGAVVIAVMALLPLGAANLLQALHFGSQIGQSSDVPQGTEGR